MSACRGIDVSRARRETPGVGNVVHFNNAGAGLMPDIVVETQKQHLDLEAAIGGYESFDRENGRIESVYDSIATLIGCGRDEIAVVENATVGWAMAFYAFEFAPGDRILTARSEYAANYIAYLQVARRTGAVVEVVPCDANGATDPNALEAMIDDRVKLISISHVPTNGGLVNPAAEIGAVAKRYDIPYLLDACQSVGQMPIEVDRLGCDVLSTTGRKYLRGPRGIGFLYVRKTLLERLEPPMLDLHSATWITPERYELRGDARRFENWETNYAAKLGLGAAVDYALDWGLEAIEERVVALAAELRQGLRRLPGVEVYDLGDRQCGIVTFALDAVVAGDVQRRLSEQHFNVSASSPASTLLDATERSLPDLVRASVHYYNDEAEISRFLEAVSKLS